MTEAKEALPDFQYKTLFYRNTENCLKELDRAVTMYLNDGWTLHGHQYSMVREVSVSLGSSLTVERTCVVQVMKRTNRTPPNPLEAFGIHQ